MHVQVMLLIKKKIPKDYELLYYACAVNNSYLTSIFNCRIVWPRDLCYVRYWRRNDDGSYGLYFNFQLVTCN